MASSSKTEIKIHAKNSIRESLEKVHSIVKKYCSADDYEISLQQSYFDQVRFAANMPTQNLSTLNRQLSIEVTFGGQSASATTSSSDEESLRDLVISVEESAKLAVENKEHMPSLGSDHSVSKSTVDSDISQMSLELRGQLASNTIDVADHHQLQCSGKVISAINEKGIVTKNGLLSDYSESLVTYEHTFQRDREASKVRVVSPTIKEFDVNGLAERSVKEIELVSPRKTFKTGRYPVVISSSAANQLLPYFIFYGGDRRAADEGRSAFAGKIGQTVGHSVVTLMTDPDVENCPASPFDNAGLRGQRKYFVKEGVLTDVQCDRFWASKASLEPWSWHNMIMPGSNKTDRELIAQIKEGFYITDIWYVRAVKMQDLTLTGMTRNALLKIEDGELVGGSEHFRWNMSFFDIFKNIREVGQSQFGLNLNRPVRFPSILVDDFYFASTTTA